MVAVLLGLASYAYFGIHQKELKEEGGKKALFFDEELLRLEKMNLVTEEGDLILEKKDDQWWVIRPHKYLANQDYIEKTLKIMEGAQPASSFVFDEDRFGFKPGKAFYHFIYDDQRQRQLILGSQEGPDNSLYVLDMDQNRVFVVHNVWGQFLYYPIQHFYHQYLPIPGALVKKLSLVQNDKLIWKVEPSDGGKMQVEWEGQVHQTERAPWLWFFNKLREFPLENVQFDSAEKAFKGKVLNIETNLGNIRFIFSEKGEEIYIPSLNVFAQVDPHSLISLGNEIKKVIKSDKK